MTTYGKKKRLILPSFSVHRDSSSGSFKEQKSKARGSIAPGVSSPRHDYQGEQEHDSIAKMASELLNDTTIQTRTLRLPRANTVPIIAGQVKREKPVPQLPQLLFNGDDAWAMRTAPVVTAVSYTNSVSFTDDSQSSAPAIPRKSSKRKSARHTRGKIQKGSISPPAAILRFPTQEDAPIDAGNKVQQMLAATAELKGHQQESTEAPNRTGAMPALSESRKSRHDRMLQGPYLPTKKGLMESKVFSRMKSAINDRLQVRSAKKRRDSVHERLLDPEWEEQHESMLSMDDLRLNEDNNLVKPKVHSVAGRSTIARKPIQTSVNSDMDIDIEPEVATVKDASEIDTTSLDEATEAELPSYTPKNKRLRGQSHRCGSDIDAILSSSPQAQSTPRLRLEPSFQHNGRTTLKHVPADSRSIFDFHSDSEYGIASLSSEMEIDGQPTGITFAEDSLKRKTTVSATASGVKRYKKHPSPNRDDLASLASKVQYLPLEEPTPTTEIARAILSGKSANENIQSGKRSSMMQGKMAIVKRDLPKTFGSMPNIGEKGRKSATRKGVSFQHSAENALDYGSAMEIDELQWDKTEYNIGARKY